MGKADKKEPEVSTSLQRLEVDNVKAQIRNLEAATIPRVQVRQTMFYHINSSLSFLYQKHFFNFEYYCSNYSIQEIVFGMILDIGEAAANLVEVASKREKGK